ncbi:MAG: hypothetical protein WBO45_12900 [Planctomycetota bacterium]
MSLDDMDDAALVAEVVAMAERQAAGTPPTMAEVSLLRAIASTRDEAKRHELAQRASDLLPTLSALGAHLVRVAIFALAA